MFLLNSLNNLRWHNYRRVPNLVLNEAWRHWLLDRGSLTQRLLSYSADHFNVQVLHQSTGLPLNSERRSLNLGLRQACLIREVALLCYQLPVVYARSIIPLKTLQGKERQLANLHEKPLGEFLFRHRNMSRGPLEIAPFHELFRTDKRPGWGRRSVFYLNSRPLLVAEFFLPDLLSNTECKENKREIKKNVDI